MPHEVLDVLAVPIVWVIAGAGLAAFGLTSVGLFVMWLGVLLGFGALAAAKRGGS